MSADVRPDLPPPSPHDRVELPPPRAEDRVQLTRDWVAAVPWVVALLVMGVIGILVLT